MPDKKILQFQLDNGQIAEFEVQDEQPSGPSLGSSFFEGMKSAPSAFIESGAGLIPAFEAVKETAIGDRAKGLKDIGQILSGMGGAAVGGALGTLGGPLAPVTVPAGAYAGGVLGSLASEVLRRNVEEKPPLTQEEAAYMAGQAAPFAAISPTLKAVGSIKKGGYTLPERLTQKVVGVSKAELGKSVRAKGMGESGEIAIAESLKKVSKEPGFREVASDPLKLKGFLEDKIANLENIATNEVASLEAQSNITPKFTWDNVKQLIEKSKGSGNASEIQRVASERIGNIAKETDLKTLSGVDKARRALNKVVYNRDDVVTDAVLDAIRKDIRQTQMKTAKRINPNSTLEQVLLDEGDRISILRKAVEPKIVGETSKIPVPRQIMRTSGGIGVPILIGASTQNPLYAIGAAGLNYLFESPKGQLALADILSGRKLPGVAGAMQSTMVPGMQLEQLQNVLRGQNNNGE
jgi:hypothetical protein